MVRFTATTGLRPVACSRGSPVRHLLTTFCVSALIATAACGGDAPDSAPAPTPTPVASAAGAFDGSYGASAVVVSTTSKDLQAGPASRQEFEYAFLCADPQCGQVFQRPDLSSGATRLFAVSGSTWTSVKDTSVACTAPASGTARQQDTFTWTRAADGSMAGKRDVTVTGCGSDSVTEFAYTVTRRVGDLAYVDGDQAAALKRVLTEYDGTAAPLYTELATCAAAQSRGETALAGACRGRVFASLGAAVTALDAALAQRPVAAPRGGCAKALDAMTSAAAGASARTRQAYQAAVAAYDAAAASNDYTAAGASSEAAITVANQQFQPAFVALATQCIAPDDLTGLGDDGVLVTDSTGLVKAQPAGG